jgi:hypothetical protein
MPYLQINLRILEKVKAIKIIKAPEIQAPEWIRKECVGLILPIAQDAPLKNFVEKVLIKEDIPDLERYIYPVKAEVMFSALKKKTPEAFQWWNKNSNLILHPRLLIFRTEECEAIYY